MVQKTFVALSSDVMGCHSGGDMFFRPISTPSFRFVEVLCSFPESLVGKFTIETFSCEREKISPGKYGRKYMAIHSRERKYYGSQHSKNKGWGGRKYTTTGLTRGGSKSASTSRMMNVVWVAEGGGGGGGQPYHTPTSFIVLSPV